MKIGNSAENTLITNTAETSQSKFKIAATGKAFQILSSALYQHKVKAVVREIGCNAYDAHIDAGTTHLPFKVSLPSKEDPHFKVRDFGIGLAEDKFVEVYTTYFGSSKADSNDHTGGLGLGSKTPFIMSKTFTVHSYYEGMEYMWHSYVNDNGEPDVVLLTKKETTEPNGLLVVVPIGQGMSDTEKNALFRDFAAEAQTIYQWFKTIPEVTTNGKPVAIKPKLDPAGKYTSLKLTGVEDTTVWYETDHSKHGQADTVMVKMGNVVYPYNLKEVRNLDRFGGAIGHAERMVKYLTSTGRLNSANFPLVVDVAMGDVDIAPSRESLSLTNTTELTIINALVRFTDMFFDKVQYTIDNAKSTFEKYQALFAVPPMGGREFKVDGVNVDPLKQPACWAFGDTAALQGRTTYLRKFSTDEFSVKYRRAGTRGLLPMTTAFDISMYGAGIKERTIILVDKVYKGELRLWVNANTSYDHAVVVVFGREVNGAQRPMTDAEMEAFLVDKHPQVVKFSQLKNQPVTTSSSAGRTALKLADDSMFVLGRTSSYNFFTQGNSRVDHLNTIKPFDPTVNKIDTVYIAYERVSGMIHAELKDPANPKLLTKVEIANWSRASGTTTTYNGKCESIDNLFSRMLDTLLSNGIIKKVTFERDGKTHPVKIQHVVLNKDGYAAVVGNPDYPQFLTLDEAINKLVLPHIPQNCEVFEIGDSEMYNASHSTSSPTSQLFHLLDLNKYTKFQQDIGTKSQTKVNQMYRMYTGNALINQHGYGGKTLTTTTHKYEFSSAAFRLALDQAASDGLAGAAEMAAILRICSTRDMFYNHYGSQGSVGLIKHLLRTVLDHVKYDSKLLDEYLIEYAKNTHKIS